MRDPVYLNVRAIDRARLVRGWTRTAMAGAARLSQETRTKIAKGGPVSIRTAKKLARTLDLPLADVLILPAQDVVPPAGPVASPSIAETDHARAG